MKTNSKMKNAAPEQRDSAPRRPLESTPVFRLKIPPSQNSLRVRLAESEETLRAIRNGEVDTMVGTGKNNRQVFTLEGAGDAYRFLIESMNEGALTLTTDKMILYANECFSKMVKRPLEQVIGSSFKEFLAEEDRAPLRAMLKSAGKSGAKVHLDLHPGKGATIPVLISVRPLAKRGSETVTVGMVVTDMTATRRTEELLRGLSHRLVEVQEIERGRVAEELHGNITQMLCAILVRSQTLARKLSPRDHAAQQEAIKLRDLFGDVAQEVERISRNLRPSVLNELGLVAVLQSDRAEFTKRTGVPLQLDCVELTAPLSAEAQLACYRIFQEALKNIERHARARHVTARLTPAGDGVELTISDDGLGFNPTLRPAKNKSPRGFGLISLRERATAVGGTLTVESAPGQGTTIRAQIPFEIGRAHV